jgi:hypothetical protein
MKKSEKIILEFFKPYFIKYAEIDSIWFLIYNFNDKIILADEDYGINGFRWDELSNKILLDSSCKIKDAIDCLKQSKVNISNIVNKLEKVFAKTQKDAYDSNPLNKILDDVWNDKNRFSLNKKAFKMYRRDSIP